MNVSELIFNAIPIMNMNTYELKFDWIESISS